MLVNTWWSDNSIELVEIDGELYALYGWNGEKYINCWKCIDRFSAVDEATEYEIVPIYKKGSNEDVEVAGYKIV